MTGPVGRGAPALRQRALWWLLVPAAAATGALTALASVMWTDARDGAALPATAEFGPGRPAAAAVPPAGAAAPPGRGPAGASVAPTGSGSGGPGPSASGGTASGGTGSWTVVMPDRPVVTQPGTAAGAPLVSGPAATTTTGPHREGGDGDGDRDGGVTTSGTGGTGTGTSGFATSGSGTDGGGTSGSDGSGTSGSGTSGSGGGGTTGTTAGVGTGDG